mgnify:CR=1 FL=1
MTSRMSLEQSLILLARDANRTVEEVESLRSDMNARFDVVDQRLDTMDRRRERLEERFDGLEDQVCRLANNMMQIIDLLQAKS